MNNNENTNMTKEINKQIDAPLIKLTKKKRQALMKALLKFNSQARQVDGFEEAFIGYVSRGNKYVSCYSITAILNIMQNRDNLTYLEALEHFDFNFSGAWVGDDTPIFFHDDDSVGILDGIDLLADYNSGFIFKFTVEIGDKLSFCLEVHRRSRVIEDKNIRAG